MALLNRVLSALILLLVIVAVVFSYKRWERRRELRERADTLAYVVSKSAKALDENSAQPIGAEVSVGDEGKTGLLGWEAWHRDASAYRGRLDQFQSRATEVRELRDQFGQELIRIGAKFDNQRLDLKQLNNPAVSRAQRDVLFQHLSGYYERDKFLVKSLRNFCELLDPKGFDMNEAALMAKENYVLGEDKVTQGIKTLQESNRRATDVLAQVVTKLGGEARVGVSPTQIKLLKTTDVEKLLSGAEMLTNASRNDAALYERIKGLNEQLGKTKDDLDRANAENARNLAKIGQLERAIVGQKNRINELEHRISGNPGR